MNVLTNRIRIFYNESTGEMEFYDEDLVDITFPVMKIRKSTLNSMPFKEASAFIGERLILLIPELRSEFGGKIPEDE